MKKQTEKMENGTIGNKLGKLEKIVEWFESQKDVDVEQGLQKVKEGASLVKELRRRMKEIENEFKEIKIELDENEK